MVFHESPEFDTFKSSFQGDIVLPSDPSYREAIARWSVLAQRDAGVVTFPKDERDVAAAIRFAVDQDLELAIRGGGHSTSSASSTNGGLVIDLSKYIRAVKVDPATQVAYVGGGALWKDVDYKAMEHGLATVGGTVNHTGVGGLALGGGFGYLSGEHGMVVDNVVGATVVLSNGNVEHCSKAENEDLFWAIRGAGCNFGVVTQFELQCHKQRPTVFCGLVFFSPDKLQAVFQALDKWEENGISPRAMMQAVCLAGPDGPCVLLVTFYNGSEAEGREYFKFVLDLGPMKDTTAERPYPQVNELINPFTEHGRCYYHTGTTRVRPTSETIVQTFDLQSKNLEMYPRVGFGTLIFIYMNLDVVGARGIADASADRSAWNKMALIEVTWDSVDKGQQAAEEEEDVIPRARTFARGLIDTIRHGSVDPNDKGYANIETDVQTGESKVKRLFGGAYPRLQKIKAKYDPNMVFNKWFPIVPDEQVRVHE